MEPDDTGAGEMRTRILDAAEGLLRRHGLEKLTVLDVARALNMSHGNVYRHIPSKAALRADVVERWLGRIADQTDAVARGDGPADVRLRDWLHGLAALKRRKVTDDSEMLAAAARIVRDAPQVEENHAARLRSQVARILRDGARDGTLPGAGPPQEAAAAILNATFRFHHPDLVAAGGPADAQAASLDAVISLLMGGLKRSAPRAG